ncbi:MAG TPA: methylglyoxal synthase [Candidatus Elarobacter sp.]|jgi:methylglyoxal synthase|nr:methylglyoxal synthase [Candidatus Elarobacter sp.]
MERTIAARAAAPRVALIAHDACKDDMVEWATFNRGTLARCEIVATGTTGSLVAKATGLPIELLLSGPLGGDAQVGAMLVDARLDLVVFFWDPLSSQPHDVDVKALLRLAVLYNVPIACNRSSADFLISSPLFLDADHLVHRRSGHTAAARASA